MIEILSCLLLIFLLFLFLPVRTGASGGYSEAEGAVFRGWVRPWGGAVGVRVCYRDGRMRIAPMVWRWAPWSLTLPRREKPAAEKKPSPRPKKAEPVEEEAEKPRPSVREQLSDGFAKVRRVYAYYQHLRPVVWRFLKRLVRGFRFRRFACRMDFGASDPATTGKVFGYALAASRVLGPNVEVSVAPDFERERLEGEAELEISVILYRLVWALGCLVLRVGVFFAADFLSRWWARRAAVAANATG